MRIDLLDRDGGSPAAATAAADPDTTRPWGTALLVCTAAILLTLGLYWETLWSMMQTWWQDDTYAHGMLVFPIALFMIWTRRHSLAQLRPHSDWPGLGLVLLICLGWLAAHAADVLVVQQFALVALIPALVYTLLGRQVAWAMAFPLLYLFFAVPVGEALVPPLQDFTAVFTVKALRLTGIPVFWEGLYFSIPEGRFEVAEACSGQRYLIASLALGCLYAYLTYRSFWRRAAFIAIAIIVPIIANGFRAYGIVLLAHYSNMKLAVGVDHLIYGWLFFGLVVFLMFWIGSWWREDDQPPAADAAAPVGAVNADGGAIPLAFAACMLLIAPGPLAMALLESPVSAIPVTLRLPPPEAPWSGPAAGESGWQPRFKGADAVVNQVYAADGRQVRLYIAYYSRQHQDAELINSQNRLYDAKQWEHFGGKTRPLTWQNSSLRLNELRLGAANHKRLIWYWYWIGGTTTASPTLGKLLEAWNRLRGAAQGSALIAIAADYEDHREQAERLLGRFIAAQGPAIDATLHQAR